MTETPDRYNESRREIGVGPPDGWIAAGDDPRTGPDSRISAHEGRKAESRQRRDDTDVDIPVRKTGTTGITQSHRNEYNVTKEEAAFMRAVVKAMNRDLEGYELTDSMTRIKEQYDINEQKLIDAGYLIRHTGCSRRVYYTITWDGQEACRTQKEYGREIGDLGAHTPHRVGIDLARNYYESLDDTRFVELCTTENGARTDLVVVNTDGARSAIVEVEGGRISADCPDEDNPDIGIKNYDSPRKDYQLMADSDGDAVWVVRNHEIAANVLAALSSGDNNPVNISKKTINRIGKQKLKLDRFHDEWINDAEWDGLDKLVTFKQLRLRLR